MVFRVGSARARQDRDLPPEIYTSLVASLYGDPLTLLVGGLGSRPGALITAWKGGGPLLLLCALAIAAVACARAADVGAFARRQPGATSVAAVRHWELRYVLGASVYVALLGVWCLLTFARAP